MTSKKQRSIERRVFDAAEAALARQNFVRPLDVLLGAGLVTEKQVSDWRHGKIPYLERVTSGGLGTVSRAMASLRKWAASQKLAPSWTAYHMQGGHRGAVLRFSKSGNPTIERLYSTHYVSFALKHKPNSAANKAKPDEEGMSHE